MDLLNQKMKIGALKSGLCNQWASEWGDELSQDELVEKYRKGINFCVKNWFPSNEDVRAFFDKKLLAKHHVWIDNDNVYDGDFDGAGVLIDECYGEMHFGGFNTPTIYVMGNSEVRITSCQHAYVFVHVYGNANVVAEQLGSGRITVKRHSCDASVFRVGDVKYIEGAKK